MIRGSRLASRKASWYPRPLAVAGPPLWAGEEGDAGIAVLEQVPGHLVRAALVVTDHTVDRCLEKTVVDEHNRDVGQLHGQDEGGGNFRPGQDQTVDAILADHGEGLRPLHGAVIKRGKQDMVVALGQEGLCAGHDDWVERVLTGLVVGLVHDEGDGLHHGGHQAAGRHVWAVFQLIGGFENSLADIITDSGLVVKRPRYGSGRNSDLLGDSLLCGLGFHGRMQH